MNIRLMRRLFGTCFFLDPKGDIITVVCANPPPPPLSADGTYRAAEAMRAMMARKIIAARTAVGFSQSALARKAGIRVETLNRLEKGKHTPDLATMAKINRALDDAGAPK